MINSNLAGEDQNSSFMDSMSDLSIQRNSQQLSHWKSLITNFPNDPLQAFWREQCSSLRREVALLTLYICSTHSRTRTRQ